MDVDTSTFVSQVSSNSLFNVNAQNSEFKENQSITFKQNADSIKTYLEEDFLIDSSQNFINSSQSSSEVNFKKFNDLNLSYTCDLASNDTTVEKNSSVLNFNENNVKSSHDVIKYESFIDISGVSAEFKPELILEENSELNARDQADLTALDDLLSIQFTEPENIGPHFITGNFSTEENLDIKEKINSNAMGIENTWNEEFAVPSTSSFAIPLPPPPENSFSDFSSCNNFDGVEHGPYASDLDALFSTNEVETDITDTNAEKGVCGLRNLGNTCFMSTGLQCLAATRSLVHFFVEKLSLNDLDENSLTVQFADLLQKIWNGHYSVIHPMKFKQALGTCYPQFKDCSQHDCQEFLALLLDALHQQLINTPKDNFERESFFFKKIENEADMEIAVDSLSTPILGEYDIANNKLSNEEQVSNSHNKNEEIVETNKLIDPFFTNNPNKEKLWVENENLEESTLVGKLNNIEDIFKEAKTSNVNVLVTEEEANNEICFDSEKFPRKERRRNISETNYYDVYDNETDPVPKDTYFVLENNTHDSSDLKRIKVHHLNKEKNCLMEDKINKSKHMDKNERLENERKMKILNVDVKLNKEETLMEIEEESCNTEEAEMRVVENNVQISSSVFDEDSQCIDLEAEKHWEKHISNNHSIIFDSFQGQFKNTVVCSACNFKSITYEPFMYLSVPLPHAIEKQICVTFISATSCPPVLYLVTLTKQDEVSKIKQYLLKLIPNKLQHPLIIGEVLDYHIAKILDDNHQIRYLDDINRSIYAFEQLLVVPSDKNESDLSNNLLNCGDNDGINSISQTCTICLEEKESDIKKHKNDDCVCILCDVCIQNYLQHFGEKVKCPVCRKDIEPEEDLVCIEQSDMKPYIRLLNVPLVYRIDKTGDGNNNQKTVKLFGHPALLKLPNQISGEDLYFAVSSLHSYKEPFKLLLVDGQGRHCSRCMFNQHCRGCIISRESHVILRTNDTLAVTFTDDVEEIREVRHSSMALQRTHKTLSLYDCVQAFSQSEILDEFNPWFCPQCKKNQCATKTLSVWRFPNYLIVYLKRFVFHECTSIKLEDKVVFPLYGFNFNKKSESPYDLYACVCHTGGVSVGHYIAYTQHPVTNEWHCFNDENVSKQKPQEEEYCNAYILFYKRRNF